LRNGRGGLTPLQALTTINPILIALSRALLADALSRTIADRVILNDVALGHKDTTPRGLS